jgi:haloalkane dehalogenase
VDNYQNWRRWGFYGNRKMSELLPRALHPVYPFRSHFWEMPNGRRMHYVDEGKGNLVLFLHDIPLWSFYFRNLIRDLKDRFHCLAPDYMGFGLSDKGDPAADYSLATIADDVVNFVTKLGVGKFSLVVHGWGGVPGMVIALRWPERVNRIILLNANCFPDFAASSAYAWYRSPILGRLLINACNRPVLKAAFSASIGSYSRRGYRFPYRSWSSRTPQRIFFENLPADGEDKIFQWLKSLQDKLYILNGKKVLAFWGERDSIFGLDTLKCWKDQFEAFTFHLFPHSGRYALEDEYEIIFPHLRRFLIHGMEAKLPQF